MIGRLAARRDTANGPPRAAGRAAAWLTSLMLHAGLATMLSVTGWMFIRADRREEVIIPDARLSDAPGGRLSDGSGELAPMAPALEAARTVEPVAVADATELPAELDDTPVVHLVGIGSAAPTALAGLGPRAPQPAGGPVSRFFGTRGNAHHVVYLVDWSGSMCAEGRYQAVQMELLRSLGDLQSAQTFALLFFSRGAPLEAPPFCLTVADDARRAAAGRFMRDRLPKPQSRADAGPVGTDPTPALRRAFELLRRPPSARPGRLIYLLTDGDFADNQVVLDELDRLNAKRIVHVNTILYATSLELTNAVAQQVLKTIADRHGGTYRWVRVGE